MFQDYEYIIQHIQEVILKIRLLVSGVLFSILICTVIMSCSHLYTFINTPTVLIVLGGVFCGTWASHPMKTIGNAFHDVFSSDIESDERALQGHQVFSNMSKYAIASGLVGMMIGLISLLSNMEDPNAIGPAMGVALLNPFYGVLAGVFFFRTLANECLSIKNIVLERQSP